MRGPSLQKATVVSGALHIMFFVITLLVMKQSARIVIPSPYVVSLVDPRGIPSSPHAGTSETLDAKAPSRETAMAQPPDAPAGKKQKEQDDRRLDERISELSSKKNIERIVKLRSIISLKGREETGAQRASKGTPTGTQTGGSSQGTLFDSYYAKITDEIRREWVFPDTRTQDLQAVVYVKVSRDGSLTVQGIEKSSGNLLFDRSALKAIAKATPVSAPPYEMEIGIRFTP